MTALSSKSIFPVILTAVLICSLPVSSALADSTIRVGGVGSSMAAISILAQAFEKSNPGYKVTVTPNLGSSGAVNAVHKGAIDIGIVGRPLRDEEARLGLYTVELARTPFIVVVRKDVEAAGMTHDALLDIYSGEKKFWPNGKLLRLVLRPSTDADFLLISEISPAMHAALDNAMSRPGMISAITDQDNADLIEKTPGAIGFSTLTQVVSEHRNLKVLDFNGVTPSVKTLQSGVYPYFKTFTLVAKNNRSAAVTLFMDFLRSKKMRQKLIELGNLPSDMK